MPITELEGIRTLIPKNLYEQFRRNVDSFEACRTQAEQIITNETGLEIPDDAADAPEWALMPAAWLIKYVGSTTLFETLNDNERNLINAEYDKALAILRSRKTPLSRNKAVLGEMEGLYS